MGTGDMHSTQWTIEEQSMLYNLKAAGKSNQEIADLMSQMPQFSGHKITVDMVRMKYRRTDWEAFFETKKKTEEMLESINNLEDEKRDIIERTIANQERLIRRHHARTEIIIDSMKSAYYRLPKPKPSEISYRPHQEARYRQEHAGIILSDSHVGESFTLEETGGLSEFNHEIFKKRAELFRTRMLEIIERHRHMYDIPELHVFSLGDIVAGMHDAGQWSPLYMDLDIYEQVMSGFAVFRDILATWAKAFKRVHFYGIYGNHGRVGKRGQEKYHINWDRICYDFLQIGLADYDNITWHIPRAWFDVPNILGKNFYLFHGDGIRGYQGIPYYGVERAEGRITSMHKDKRIDYFLLGHFHSPAELQTNNGRIIMNGSWVGGDMFSIKDLKRLDRPEQKMFGIHEKRGITWMYNIDLAGD